MNISSATDLAPLADAQWLGVPLFEDDASPVASLRETPLGPVLARLLAAKLLPTGLGDSTPILGAEGIGGDGTLAFGLGKRGAFRPASVFGAGVHVAKRLGSKPVGKIAVLLPDVNDLYGAARSLTEGLVVGTSGPDLHKREKGRHSFESVVLIGPGADPDRLARAVRRGEIVGHAVNLARELVNTPPDEKTPAQFAERSRVEAEGAGVKVTVWDEARIREERFGGLLGVSAGSDHPPRFVVLEWSNNRGGPTIALVGKGVTFDSGGLSLKPSASMEDMKSDMTGAAVVLATIRAVAQLGLPINVVGYLPMTENMTGGRAMKLGDVLTMRNGKTVEVLNTDAEGRLILADALSYAAESHPDRILDLATLTGACIVALGGRIAGLFGKDDAFAGEILAASRITGERAWRMPLDDDFLESLKSTVADLKNVGGKWGGAVTAAKFLEQFVGDVPWAHLDIAGPSWADAEGPMRDAGGTGCFVRTLVTLLEANP